VPQYDENSAECLVFTFKEGLLAKIAHDLKVRVTKFSVNVDPATPSVRAEFDAQSLRVVNAMKDGEENPSSLSDADKEKIAGQIVDDVLHAKEFTKVTFVSTQIRKKGDGGYDIKGELTLHGVKKEISAETIVEGGRQVADVELNQVDYGIKPFKALMGTLKVKPVLRVRLSLPNP